MTNINMLGRRLSGLARTGLLARRGLRSVAGLRPTPRSSRPAALAARMTISPLQLAAAPMSTSAGAGSPAELLANSNWDEGTAKFDATQLRTFVEGAVALCKPDAVHLVDGSDAENEM